MKPLLQHAPRSLLAGSNAVTSSLRAQRSLSRTTAVVCWSCQYRTAPTIAQGISNIQLGSRTPRRWLQRGFTSSARCLQDEKPPKAPEPIQMPAPSTSTTPTDKANLGQRLVGSSEERLKRLQEEWEEQNRKREEEAKRKEEERLKEEARQQEEARLQREAQLREEAKQREEAQERERLERRSRELLGEPSARSSTTSALASASSAAKSNAADDIARVPDEHLPSHRERQRWDLSKRFNKAMDDLLPKIAVVTQKVNTYTGTDYSGVAALRAEIKEQEQLVRTRRHSIDAAKTALDTANAHQAASQKEVVALLERKHSWSSADLERYMSLIRSEHLNDQAVREAKEAVDNAETALEDARAQLEKRERAQYHEEQIWSDTIRRNSTWVTFGLMGVNIFLLLLSLAVLEPYRRKRMVREIKNTLEAQQKVALEAAATTPAPAATLPAMSAVKQETTAVEASSPASVEPAVVSNTLVAGDAAPPVVEVVPVGMPAKTSELSSGAATPAYTRPVSQEEIQATLHNVIEDTIPIQQPRAWHEKISAVAHDVVSDRVISIRRIDYTAAVLQGAAAGAVITAAVIAMLRPN